MDNTRRWFAVRICGPGTDTGYQGPADGLIRLGSYHILNMREGMHWGDTDQSAIGVPISLAGPEAAFPDLTPDRAGRTFHGFNRWMLICNHSILFADPETDSTLAAGL
jgi:hypothetical protein